MNVILWGIVAIFAIVIDINTSTFLFFSFSIGAILAMIGEFLGVSLGVQIIIFIVCTILSFAILYPLVKKKFKINKKKLLTMEESFIGKVLTSNEKILKDETNARIKVSGVYWSGINLGDTINIGEKFKIIGIKGSKFQIKKIEEENKWN